MMTNAVKGKSHQEAEALIKEFREMLVIGEDKNFDHLGRLKVLAGVRDLPTRVKCAILPWHTLYAAINSTDSATTEADDHASKLVANNH